MLSSNAKTEQHAADEDFIDEITAIFDDQQTGLAKPSLPMAAPAVANNASPAFGPIRHTAAKPTDAISPYPKTTAVEPIKKDDKQDIPTAQASVSTLSFFSKKLSQPFSLKQAVSYDPKVSEPLHNILAQNIDCKALETLIDNFNLDDLKDQKFSLKTDSPFQLDFQYRLDLQAHIWRNHHLLGAVSNNKTQLFEESDDSISCAKYFLSAAYSAVKFKEILMTTHKNNCDRQKTKTPMCILFLTFTFNNKKYCFVSISKNFYSKTLNEHVGKLITAINKYSYSAYEFITSPEAVSLDFSDLLLKINNKIKPNVDAKNHPCAEKTMLNALCKLFYTYGNEIKIEGAANFYLYPYEYKIDYTIHPNVIRFSQTDSKKEHSLTNGHFCTSRDCCSSCTAQKDGALFLLTVGLFQLHNLLQPKPSLPAPPAYTK